MGHTDGEGVSRIEMIRNNWNGFRKFMWNSEERTVMGRGGKSWAKISFFYLIYYSCLAGFWAAMLAIFLQTVSYDRPKFTSLVSTPALHLTPVPDSESRLRWEPKNPDSYESITKEIQKLIDDLQPSDDSDLMDCTGLDVGSVQEGQRFCKFNITSLGACNNPPNFGWDTLQPCLFLRLNRAYNWIPVNYAEQKDVPDRTRSVYMDNNVAINCFPRRKEDEKKVNSTTPFPTAGIPFGFFPYVLGANDGEARNKLIQPVVAVQVSLSGPDEAAYIDCQTFTGNINPRGGLFDTDEPSQIKFYLNPRTRK